MFHFPNKRPKFDGILSGFKQKASDSRGWLGQGREGLNPAPEPAQPHAPGYGWERAQKEGFWGVGGGGFIPKAWIQGCKWWKWAREPKKGGVLVAYPLCAALPLPCAVLKASCAPKAAPPRCQGGANSRESGIKGGIWGGTPPKKGWFWGGGHAQ